MDIMERRAAEVVDIWEQWELGLHSVDAPYRNLKLAFGTTERRLEEIARAIERRNRDGMMHNLWANGTSLVGGILTIVGVFGAPFTFGASVPLATAGGTLLCTGGVASLAGIYSYIGTKMDYNEAMELLANFKQLKQELCEHLLRVYEIYESMAVMRQQRYYNDIFNLLYPEFRVEYRTAMRYFENFDNDRLYYVLQSANGAVNVGTGVYALVELVEQLATTGQKITQNLVANCLIPVGIVVDSAFLIATIQELMRNDSRKCEAAELAELIRDVIREEMRTIDNICPALSRNFAGDTGS